MSFDAFTKLCGYQNYYGLNEYPYQNDFDGHWGIWDEQYLQYFAKEINKKRQPFFSTVFTLSSHDPYNVPNKYKAIFKDGKLPITKTIAYTDFALRQFFNAIKKTSWFKNTLFVFTADHTSNTQNPIFQNSYGYHKIPIIFYQYNQTPKVCKTITQQIDILPNVMEYLNYDQSYFSFGKSTFQNTNSNNISLHYVDGIYETFTNIQLVKFDTQKVTSVYDLTIDSLIQNNVQAGQKINPFLLQYSRAFLQTYTQCLTQNKMTVENYFRK
jgi:phosphoglycerol transferase MdoB-like AlkP superfamily enzyme